MPETGDDGPATGDRVIAAVDLSAAELDWLIAERVMGFARPVTFYDWRDRVRRANPMRGFLSSPYGDAWYSTGAYKGAAMLEDGTKYYCGTPGGLWQSPQYSSNAERAVEVLRKLIELQPVVFPDPVGFRVRFMVPGVEASADNFALAICRAAALTLDKP